jgi:hypothetical protein
MPQGGSVFGGSFGYECLIGKETPAELELKTWLSGSYFCRRLFMTMASMAPDGVT